MANSSRLIYNQGLASANFTVGPGGGWVIKKGTYRVSTSSVESKDLLAIYDPTYKAPTCAVADGISCDSVNTAGGRDNVAGMVEQNFPNVLPLSGIQCPDDVGSLAAYRIDNVKVRTVDGQSFAPGKNVEILTTVYLVDTADDVYIDFFYSNKTNNVQGTDMQNKGFAAFAPYDGDTGVQLAKSTPFALSSGGDAMHFVRVNLSNNDSARGYCTHGSGLPTSQFHERDDLVFKVGS